MSEEEDAMDEESRIQDLASRYILSGEEKIIGKPTITDISDNLSVSEVTSYGSSEWHRLNKLYREEHPLVKKELTPEEKMQCDSAIEDANKLWRKLKEEKEKIREEADLRMKERLGLW